MDFQRLFKRKEEVALHSMAGENQKETLGKRVVVLSPGDLMDGHGHANLLWNNVGGAINLPADKILGILEGRTRVKAAVLQEIYPTLFEKDPHPGTEFCIPLQVVVTQLEDVFESPSDAQGSEAGFETPFGQLAREDEARFKERPEWVTPPAKAILRPGQGNGSKETGHSRSGESGLDLSPAEPPAQSQDEIAQATLGMKEPNSAAGEAANHNSSATPEPLTVLPTAESDHHHTKSNGSSSRESVALSGNLETRRPRPTPPESTPKREGYPSRVGGAGAPGLRQVQSGDGRRSGHEALQELFLIDDQLDGAKVADLILKLPRVTGVVIMLVDGAVLGGGLSGGISESLLSLAPDFVQDLVRFTGSLQGGPTQFVTLAGNACLISLTIGGQVLVLAGHEGKNLPPGLRERLVATAQALNLIYGPHT